MFSLPRCSLSVAAVGVRRCALDGVRYIGWIDIGYVVNDRFLGLFAECLRSPDEQLVQRSCSCILEVVNKVTRVYVF